MIINTPDQIALADALFQRFAGQIHQMPINCAVAAAMMVIADAFDQQPGDDYKLEILAFTISAARDIAKHSGLSEAELDAKVEIGLAVFEANRQTWLN